VKNNLSRLHPSFIFDQLKTVNLDPKTLDPTVLRRPEALPLEEMYIKPMKSKERVARPFAWFFALFKNAPWKTLTYLMRRTLVIRIIKAPSTPKNSQI